MSALCQKQTSTPLFDYLVGAGKQGRRQLEAKRLCRGQVDDHLEMCRLLDWKVGWFFTLDDASAVLASRAIHLDCIWAIRDQRPVLGSSRKAVNGSAFDARYALENLLSIAMRKWTRISDVCLDMWSY